MIDDISLDAAFDKIETYLKKSIRSGVEANAIDAAERVVGAMREMRGNMDGLDNSLDAAQFKVKKLTVELDATRTALHKTIDALKSLTSGRL